MLTNFTHRTEDERAIRELYNQLLASWTQNDGHAYARFFTEDADYIIANGFVEHGRQEIAANHQAIFDTWARGSRLEGEIERVRFLSEDMALILATGSLILPDQPNSADEHTRYSLLAQRLQSGWHFAFYQNTPIHNSYS